MTEQIYLDPNETSLLEPREGDEHNYEAISPFAVPDSIQWDSSSADQISQVVFIYPGGERGETLEELDDADNPLVMVETTRYTGKIMRLAITPPVDAQGLRRIAGRLRERGGGFSNKAKKFSFLMISGIMEKWADR